MNSGGEESGRTSWKKGQYLSWAQRMAAFELLGLKGKGTPCCGNHTAKALSCPRNTVIVLIWNVGFVGEQKKKD